MRASTMVIVLVLTWTSWLFPSDGERAGGLITVALRDRFADPASARAARVSAGGRFVVFTSNARLLPADRNSVRDVYVLDLQDGRLTLETAGRDGTAADGDSVTADISRDGRYVTFESAAGNLGAGPLARGTPRVFLRDRQTLTTRLLATRGDQANGYGRNPMISADGTTIVFESSASHLAGTEDRAGGGAAVFLVRHASGESTRLDVARNMERRGGRSASPAVSGDGRYVAFMTTADLTCSGPPDGNDMADIYLRDAVGGFVTQVSRGVSGRDANGPSYDPAISGDGRYVAFVSAASNLTRDSGRRTAQVYLHDVLSGTTELVSRTSSGRWADGPSLRPSVSLDGSTIAYQSLASDILCAGRCSPDLRDTNLMWDVFVHDRRTRRTIQASAGDGDVWMEASRGPSLDETGRVLAFSSRHPTGEDDAGHDDDLYVWLDVSRAHDDRARARRRSPARSPGPPPATASTDHRTSAAPPSTRGASSAGTGIPESARAPTRTGP